MKRLLTCLFFALMPFTAAANTDLARDWGLEATRLSEQTFELIFALDMGQTVNISDEYALDVYRFGRTSADLAGWIDRENGPNDLGCIFRGMATESGAQLEALDAARETLDQRASLQRLAGMFADAEMIAITARRRSPTTGRVAATLHQVCAANPHTVMAGMR